MAHDYLEGLNDAQREAVLHTTGPLLVLAGAGSGKTRVITHRIVHLVHQGVAPHNILAVTFTNKAAKEMRERAMALLQQFPPSDRAIIDSYPTVTTFHSLGVRLLREHHATLNLPRHFVIYDRSDSVKAIKTALEQAGYNPKQFEPRKILSIISRTKGDAISQSDFSADARSYPEQVAAAVWTHYADILRNDKALDFDDLLVKTLQLLTDYPVIRDVVRERYRYLHIDEYQDTNKVQFAIARVIAGEHPNICVVGDIDQSIYSWRGADISNVLQFERHFTGAKTILLEENYRSTQTIIAASNQVIAQNKNRVEKTVFTSNATGEKITLYAAQQGIDEAEYIALQCKQLISEGARPSDTAVLFRTNFQSRVLEEAFLNFNVPYQVLGTKFFERKEVKDVLSFLRLALNPDTTADLARIVNVPPRGIGKVTALKLIEGRRDELAGATAEKVARFDQLMQDITDHARIEPISKTLRFIMSRTGIETHYKKSGTEEDLERLENLRELVSLAVRFDELDPEEGVEALLENAALQSDQDELGEHGGDAVRLMTVHAAKGLEFPYVFVSGLEEGLFPHERLDDRGVDHEEERRLFYVALTRAEKKVWLTYAHLRTIFGSQRVNIPSSFLNDIDTEHVELEGTGGFGQSSGYETTIYLD
ncbi:ATP-dependent DNA helicase PcrA [bacterium]|nr:ATP-dependent DNA helicase PcrA [bacterium]|tara:strand:- start:527 stop:2479 length:1953 start_codon:yes stop_codon:yes gene_type:complete